MKKILMMMFLFAGCTAHAQTAATNAANTSSAAATNPLDLSKYKDIAGGKSLPSVQSVTNARNRAEALVKQDKCSDAVPELENWATQANWLANLISAGLEPYYGAPYSKTKDMNLDLLEALVPLEAKANSYKEERNIATVLKAECLVKLKRTNEAAAVYARALDLIDFKDTVNWNRAMTGLYKLIGVPAPKF